ncbi:centrosomal protein kizuna, partial [Oenanthe melanoleuca]|uniref:centrosomal protein kizuna n=1 Tax=Oenanthe melanoleuca TaxID=2939378 RepID=UPI0024C17F2A
HHRDPHSEHHCEDHRDRRERERNHREHNREHHRGRRDHRERERNHREHNREHHRGRRDHRERNRNQREHQGHRERRQHHRDQHQHQPDRRERHRDQRDHRDHRDREWHRARGRWDRRRSSEANRLELGRQQMEYTMAHPHLAGQRRLELQRRLAAVRRRRRRALRRNRALRRELLQLRAHMDTAAWDSIRDMEEWYGREIKNLLSLGEGSLSAGGDKEEGSSQQVLQAGIGSRAVPGELGCPTPAASATAAVGSQQEPPSPKGLCTDTGTAAGESEEGAAGHRDLPASEEGSEQLSSASGARAAPPRPGHVPGVEPGLSRQGSSAELPVPAEEEEEARPSIPDTQQEQGRDARALEPLDSSAPHRNELSELCHTLQLLQDLVERTSPQHRALYQGQPLELLSAGAGAGRLAQGDLEVMEALVLQQLQQAVSPRSRSLPEEHSRDAEALRALLSHHGLFLKQHRVRLPEGVAEMFEQLLASGEERQDGQVLREPLPGEPGHGPPVQSEESSLSLPSIPSKEGKQGELAQKEPDGDRAHGSPEGSASLGTHLESSSVSDGSTPPSSRTELRKETVAAIKSKAFWGESDESSSELEAALRPQAHGADSDDFDDFYD